MRFPGLSILTTASIKPELHSLHPDALIGSIIPKDLYFDQQMIANIVTSTACRYVIFDIVHIHIQAQFNKV